MKKTSMIALLAMFLTASVTFATANFQAIAQDDPPVLDCWSNKDDVNDENNPPQDMSIQRDCHGNDVDCCYTPGGGVAKTDPF